MRIHGRNGIVYLSPSNGTPASPLAFQSDWSMSFAAARAGITPVGDRGQTYVDQIPDVTGDFTGIYDDATSQTYLSAIDGLHRNFYLYPDSTRPYKFFYGTILPDFNAAAGVASGGAAKTTWAPSGQILKSPLGPVVTLLGQDGTFGTMVATRYSSTGHTFATHPVQGWQFGKGACVFYSRATPDGQIVMTTLPFTTNEIQPTADHAEICTYNPVTDTFIRQVIPTANGNLTAVDPATGLGGTDVGSGDCVIVTIGGTSYVLLTCEGYYFNWDIGAEGLYPVLCYLALSAGAWSYDAGHSLTSNQWEATNPTAYAVIAPNGIATGNNGTIWPTRAAGQMCVLPQSGRVVVGHYFGTGAIKSGVISVSDSSGNLLAAYQVPNITPTDGTTITSASVRDMEADPTGALNDERFVIIYDAFGTGVQQCFQEFSYNESTKAIAPVSLPTCPADTNGAVHVAPSFAFIDPVNGALYISCSKGLNGANLSVYLKHGATRTNVSSAPVVGGWESTSWPTPVRPDYSLGFPVGEGLQALAGPLQVDPLTGALLVAGRSLFTAAVPDASIASLGANLLSAFASGFEPANALTANDATYAASQGTWAALLGTVSRVTPPVAPPKGLDGTTGTLALRVNPFSGSSSVHAGVTTYAATPGKSYQADTWFLANTVGRTCEFWMRWINSSGVSLGDNAHTTVTDNTTTWTHARNIGTAPANTAFIQLWVQVDSPGAGEGHFWCANDIFLLDATAAGWTASVTTMSLSSDQALDGSFSLKLTAPFTQSVLSATSPSFAVTPYRDYLAKASFRANSTGFTCGLSMAWKNGAGASLGTTAGTLIVTDSSSGFTEAWCGGMAPAGAATATITLAPNVASAGDTHYCDRVTIQAQPWTAIPQVDYGPAALRALGYAAVGPGRPSQVGRILYIPVTTAFSGAENTAYGSNGNGYVPAYKPQFLAAVDLSQLLGQ